MEEVPTSGPRQSAAAERRRERQQLQHGPGRPSKEERRRERVGRLGGEGSRPTGPKGERERKRSFSFFLFDFPNPFSKVFEILLNFGSKPINTINKMWQHECINI
jgi:hypothetical protein